MENIFPTLSHLFLLLFLLLLAFSFIVGKFQMSKQIHSAVTNFVASIDPTHSPTDGNLIIIS